MKWEEIQEKADLAHSHLMAAYELLDEIDNEEIEDAPLPDFIEEVDVDTAMRRIVNAMNEVADYTTWRPLVGSIKWNKKQIKK